MRRQLVPRIGPDYIIQLEKYVSIHDLPPEPRRLLGRPDLSVVRAGSTAAGQPNFGGLEAPAEVLLPALDVERFAYLEIRDRRGREFVTVIELLSPSNKRPGDDRQQYLAKRREIFRNDAHLVEVEWAGQFIPDPA